MVYRKNLHEQEKQNDARAETHRADTRHHDKKAESYEADIEALKSEIEVYKSKDASTASELLETRKNLAKFEREQRGIGSNRQKVSDDDLVSSWMQVDYRIRGLAALLAIHIPAGGYIEAQVTRKRFRAISRTSWNYKGLLQDPDMGPLLLQAYLWRVVEDFLYPDYQRETCLAGELESVRIQMLSKCTRV